MGDMAGYDIEQGEDMWFAHLRNDCLEDCIYCQGVYTIDKKQEPISKDSTQQNARLKRSLARLIDLLSNPSLFSLLSPGERYSVELARIAFLEEI